MQHMCRKLCWDGRCSWLSVAMPMVLLLLAWHGAPPGWGDAAELLDGIAAVVNNEIITIGEVQEAMAPETEQLQQRYSGQSLQKQVKERFVQTLQSLIDVRLQLERARKLNLQVSNEDVTFHLEALKKQNQITDEQLGQMLHSRGLTLETYQQQVREGLLITKVVNVEVRSRLIVLDTELQESYQKRRQRYSVPGALTVSHILFLVSPDAPEAEVEHARQKADRGTGVATVQGIRRLSESAKSLSVHPENISFPSLGFHSQGPERAQGALAVLRPETS